MGVVGRKSDRDDSIGANAGAGGVAGALGLD